MTPYAQGGTWLYDVTNYGADNTGQTDPIEAMQRAYDQCVANGNGGVVFAPPGDYVRYGPQQLVMGAPHVSFEGAGMGLTRLSLADGIATADMDAAPAFINVKGYTSPTGYADRVFLRGFTIDGRRANQEYTSHFTTGINAFNVRGGGIVEVEVKSWHSPVAPGEESVCLHLVDSPMSHIRHCVTTDSPEVQGARLSGQAIGSSVGGRIVNHQAEGCMSGAVLWQVVDGAIVAGRAHLSTYFGFDVEDCRGCSVVQAHASASQQCGVRFSESIDCSGVGIVARNNNQARLDENQPSAGITVNGGTGGPTYGSLRTHLAGNKCYDDQSVPTQNFGVQENEEADYTFVVGGNYHGNVIAAHSLSGTHSRYSPENWQS
jgi:hypothetical protein